VRPNGQHREQRYPPDQDIQYNPGDPVHRGPRSGLRPEARQRALPLGGPAKGATLCNGGGTTTGHRFGHSAVTGSECRGMVRRRNRHAGPFSSMVVRPRPLGDFASGPLSIRSVRAG
jgi:hypothetical protein